ncbi:profilin [Boletus coccyginus]|nr:profilin [Boletus coccyginus]
MSWQVYVDSNLLGSGMVKRAAILGVKGGVWATSAGYALSPQEQKAIIGAFNDQDATQASGVRLAGQKFFTLRCDHERIYGKKGADGCVLVKTKQAILVTEYVAPTQAPEATPVVEGLADYLKNAGF